MGSLALALLTIASILQRGVPGDLFGSSSAGIGDVDGDGHGDLAVSLGAWGEELIGPGVALYSGRTTEVLWTGAERIRTQRFEDRALHRIEDLDGDGVDDLAYLGMASPHFASIAPCAAFRIILLSGRDGSSLREWPVVEDGATMASIDVLGDVDGDSVTDLAVAVTARDWSTVLRVDSCRTGRVVRTFAPAPPGWTLKPGVECVGDVDLDGCGDLALFLDPEPPYGPSSPLHRRDVVVVMSSADGRKILSVEADGPWSPWVCCGVGDLDGDRRAEIAVAGSTLVRVPWRRMGYEQCVEIRIHSGRDGRCLRTIPGILRDTKGISLCSPGDVDGDGSLDVLLGEYRLSASFPHLGGIVRLHSARDGSLVRESELPPILDDATRRALDVSEYHGSSLAAAGDVDADGVPDWLVGQHSPWGDEMASQLVVVSGRDGSAIHVLDRRTVPR